MRYLIVCNGSDEAAVAAEATQRSNLGCPDRVIILSSRGGSAWERDAVLSVPLTWALKDVDPKIWGRKDRKRKSMTFVAGLRSARFFGGVQDLLTNIDASDPDVIDLSKLGAFGRWLQPKCATRFRGRKVIVSSDSRTRPQDAASWRTYDKTALVSIILPVYNGARYLAQSIESCLKQTHKNIELIIVDDGSIDDTAAIIRKYAAMDQRITPIRNETNLGLPETLNVGFRTAKGHFLTWTSDDNFYSSVAIEYMVQQLCTFPKVGLVYCCAHPIDECGNLIDPPYFVSNLPPTALSWWSVIGGCFLYRRQVMERVGPYRPECKYYEDWDFFIRACTKFAAKHYFEPCYYYRKHTGSLTHAHGEKWRSWLCKLHEEHFDSGRNPIVLPTADQLIPAGCE